MLARCDSASRPGQSDVTNSIQNFIQNEIFHAKSVEIHGIGQQLMACVRRVGPSIEREDDIQDVNALPESRERAEPAYQNMPRLSIVLPAPMVKGVEEGLSGSILRFGWGKLMDAPLVRSAGRKEGKAAGCMAAEFQSFSICPRSAWSASCKREGRRPVVTCCGLAQVPSA